MTSFYAITKKQIVASTEVGVNTSSGEIYVIRCAIRICAKF